MEKVSISGGDGQTTSNHHDTANLLNRLNLPKPTTKSFDSSKVSLDRCHPVASDCLEGMVLLETPLLYRCVVASAGSVAWHSCYLLASHPLRRVRPWMLLVATSIGSVIPKVTAWQLRDFGMQKRCSGVLNDQVQTGVTVFCPNLAEDRWATGEASVPCSFSVCR